MLFTRNHEKEVELEALKDAYEYEIDLIIQDARSKLEKQEVRIQELVWEKGSAEEKAKSDAQKALAERDAAWQQKLTALEQQVQSEKAECQSARDMLITAQQDIERLRNGQSDDASRLSAEVTSKSREIDKLKSTIKSLEQNLNDKQHKLSNLNSLDKTNEGLRKDLEHYKEDLKATEKLKEQVLVRNKALENELRQLKREFQRRLSDKGAAGSASSSNSGAMVSGHNAIYLYITYVIQR